MWMAVRSVPLDYNGPSEPYYPLSADWLTQSVFVLFERIALRQARAAAIIDPAGGLNYGQVLACVRGLAGRIERSAQGDGAIGILLPNSIAYPVAVLACLLARRPCVLLDSHYPAARNAAIMKDAQLAGVVTDGEGELAGILPDEVMRIPLRLTESYAVPGPAEIPSDDPDRPAFVIYTSGSTGQPKGIVQSQRAILRRVGQLIESKHLGPSDRFLSLASPCTIDGLFDSLASLLSGALLLKIDLRRNGLREALRFCRDQRATVLLGLPSVLRALAELPEAAEGFSSLRVVRTSGDALLLDDFQMIRRQLPTRCHFLSVFGATEAGAMLQWFITPDAAPTGPRLPAGYALPGYRLAILDGNGGAVSPGGVGELVVSSPYTALGEWQGGQCVPGRLPPDPADTSCRILRTGDLAQLRPDGLFALFGRLDRQIKIGGHRVEPAEIEVVLQRSPNVLGAVVLPLHEEANISLLAFVVPAPGIDANLADALHQALIAALPAHMRPSRVIVIDAIPRLPGGKVDAEALINCARDGSAGMTTTPLANAAANMTLRGMATRVWRRVTLMSRLNRSGS